MRARVVVLVVVAAVLAAGCATMAPPPPRGPHGRPPASVGIDFFYTELGPYGDWIEVELYGWVWVPWNVPYGWRPYTYGRWVRTPYGWTWLSSWPWGWAPFHYGRWVFHPRFGWIWRPGRVWAPAWVAWRHGAGWVGWAPLPPRASWRVGFGFDIDIAHIDVTIASDAWCYVAEPLFDRHDLHLHVAPVGRNPTLFHGTRHVTHYVEERGEVYERGLSPDRLDPSLVRRMPMYRVTDEAGPPTRRAVPRDGAVPLYRPPVTPPRSGQEPPPPTPHRPTGATSAQGTRSETGAAREAQDREAWERSERERLERIQAEERSRPPAGVSERELRERQEAERKAQRDAAEREKAAAESRSRHDSGSGQPSSRRAQPRSRSRP